MSICWYSRAPGVISLSIYVDLYRSIDLYLYIYIRSIYTYIYIYIYIYVH